jgi:hypothetical protein
MSAETYGTEIEAQFIAKVEGGEWPHFEWRVTLKRDGKARVLPYRMGLGHIQTPCGKPIQPSARRYGEPTCDHVRCQGKEVPTPPDLYTVLTSLKADATHGETFDDWCANFGYDTDSRKAMETYLACQASEAESRQFFGADWARLLDDEAYE